MAQRKLLILADPSDRLAVGPEGFDREAIERSRLSKDAPPFIQICGERIDERSRRRLAHLITPAVGL